jgi:hypothetical protein
METTMQKTALTIFCALLISGMAVQVATASEYYGHKAYFGRDHGPSVLRRAYNQANGPIDVAPQALDRVDADGFGFGGRDPSWVGGKDPSLNPSGN